MNPRLSETVAVIVSILLAVTDRYLDFLLWLKRNERVAPPPTTRRRFSREERIAIRRRQNSLCMYCGVALNRNNLSIDHIQPLDRGGPDTAANLQATCKYCNSRKGNQTDAEFRRRYLLPARGGPPKPRIPERKFAAITRQTTRAARAGQRQPAVFRTQKSKITSGSLMTGLVAGLVWLFGFTLVFGSATIVAQISLWGGIIIGGVMSLGLIGRATYTGRMIE